MIKSMGRMLSPLNWVRFPKQRLLQDVRFVRNLDPRVASWTPELAIFQTFFRGFLYNLFLGMGILGGYFTEARWENLWNFRSILGGFKCFFIFNPTLGKWSNLTDIFSSNGFVQPTTRFLSWSDLLVDCIPNYQTTTLANLSHDQSTLVSSDEILCQFFARIIS